MTDLSRRRMFGLSGAAVAGGVAGSLLPPSLHRAMAAPMRPGGLDSVEHVVVLMQENRSFDHYFGTLRGVRGFADADPLPLRGGGRVFEQPRPGGDPVLPFSVRAQAVAEGRDPADIQYLGDLDHSWDGSGQAWAGGWNDGWVPAKTPATMTYYERADIALQYELADTFTLCDAYHCSVFGSTNPNRNYLWSGTVGFEPGSTDRRAVGNDAYDHDHAGYDWTTYPERLQDAGVAWRIYQEWDNFTDNAVEYFARFKRIGARALTAVGGDFRTTAEFYETLPELSADERRRLLGRFDAGVAALPPDERELFDRAVFRGDPGSLVPRLRADIAAGTLPTVSWLVPSAADSEHPGASTPAGSANFVYDVLDAIAADPDTWSKTVLLLNFDENDGYFDHVAPPVPPAGHTEDADHYRGRPIGFGPRVPMTVVSPWTVGGFVDSRVYDHTSVLRLLERLTGVAEPNISAWRRAVAGDLTGAFDFDRQSAPPRPAAPGPVPEPIERWHPEPPGVQAMPAVEPGARPARPLPYRCSVSGGLDGAGRLTVRLANSGAAQAHFAIYPYRGEFPAPVHRTVAGEQSETTAPLIRYDLLVQGPNRGWWRLRGDRTGQAAMAETITRFLPGRGGLELTLRNPGRRELTFRLTSTRHIPTSVTVRVRPGRSASIAWPTAEGWYDVRVTADEDAAFERTLTGRVENGRPGVSG